MAIQKTSATHITSQSVAAGDSLSGSLVDCSANIATRFYGSVTNGATGPTIPAVVTVQSSPDGGTTWVDKSRVVTNVGNNVVTNFSLDVGIAVKDARVTLSGHTGQPVTVVCYLDTVNNNG